MSNDAPPRSRKTLWLVAAVCIAPFIASFTAYYFYKPEGRVNYGQLMDAKQLPRTPMTLTDGKPFSLQQLEGKWLFVMVDDAACDAYCEKKLWQIRQIRKKMFEVIAKESAGCDLKEMVQKFIPEVIGKEIEKVTQKIYPLSNVYVRKVKILKSPRFDLGKLLEMHGEGAAEDKGKPVVGGKSKEFKEKVLESV